MVFIQLLVNHMAFLKEMFVEEKINDLILSRNNTEK